MKKAIAVITIGAIILTLYIMQTQQLKYPLDPTSKKVLEQTVDEFLEDKIFDLIWKRTFHWITFFESLDGFTMSADGLGTNVLSGADLNMTTGAVSGNANEIIKQPSWQGLMTFSRRSAMRTSVVLTQVTTQTIYLVTGGLSSGSYYGFKIVNATLSGVSYNGTTETLVTLATLIGATTYNLEARYSPKDKIVFYVNSVDRGTINHAVATSLPLADETSETQLMDIKLTTNTIAAKTMQVSFFEYFQLRNILK